MDKMPSIAFAMPKPAAGQIAGAGPMEAKVTSNFPSARKHLEEAHRLLVGEDDLTVKSRQAIEILIDAFLATEYSPAGRAETVIDLAEARRRRAVAKSPLAAPVA